MEGSTEVPRFFFLSLEVMEGKMVEGKMVV